MKHFLYIIIGVVVLMTSCDKETSSDGALDGFWLLVSIDSLASDSHTDTSAKGLTWSFQFNKLELRDIHRVSQTMIVDYEHRDNYLFLKNPYLVNRDSDDIRITSLDGLLPYGINSLEEKYQILELSGNRLELASSQCRLRLKKY